MEKRAIIIGAGPAGLTAAYELVTKTDIKPVIIEMTNDIGGISKTVVHQGNRMDIGGHRFFSKSDVVMNWWQNILPMQGSEPGSNEKRTVFFTDGPDPEKTDRVMLVRNRLSRIFYLGKFFDYPVKLNFKTITNLGIMRIIKIGWAYFLVKIFPVKKINSLEDFFISRFGKELYETFFKDYTQKIWGVPCHEIAADWGTQRIKKLSVSRTLLHAIKTIFVKDRTVKQQNTDSSLIERFLYPKYGPGQLWETVADIIQNRGGLIIKNSEVTDMRISGNKISEVTYCDHSTKKTSILAGDYFISTMPVKDLINAMGEDVPQNVKTISSGLPYRDSITVGLLLNKLKIKNETDIPTLYDIVPDNWIYIQERDVKLARIQIYNNWSPYLLKDINKIWLGLEYCCSEGDELWTMNETDFIHFAVTELNNIGITDGNDVIDSMIVKTPKTYPAYSGTHAEFNIIRQFTDNFSNLFLIGRNGMHRYYNQDHAMLTAMTAVKNIMTGEKSKDNIWNINADEEYIEIEND
ncbi:MAG: NAD(P)/FAD-dependent oxidoreductase [Smithella sp.]|nr:NAD(P)/FAD-dependent oxidoreductase [Smithella sp.]